MENLGLDPVDMHNSGEYDNVRNHAIIKRFLERAYNRSGRGGLFPIKRVLKDQRRVEIWYQMMDYISQEGL